MSMLRVRDVDSYYGTSHVLQGISLAVDEGSLVTLIGRNGAGKTTTLKTIMGMIEPRAGTVTFSGEDITGMETHEIAQRGISIIPEHRELFPQLTVRENLRMGHLGHDRVTDPGNRVRQVYEYFPRLEERMEQVASSLSGGEQQMLAIGRALVSDPSFLLIDEPTEGLMPTLVEKLRDILVRINKEEEITMLLVEQNVKLALDISDYAYVIDEGTIQFEGESGDIAANEQVKRTYLAV